MSAALSPSLPEFYTWGFATAPIEVHLYLSTVSTIREQIADSNQSSCGLLFGDLTTPGITKVLANEPLETLDAASVSRGMARASGKVVGFYRTIAPGTGMMMDADRELAADLFRDISSVFLLIETERNHIGDARFCFWGETELFDWPMMLFPFDDQLLAAKESRRRAGLLQEANAAGSRLDSGVAGIPVALPAPAKTKPAAKRSATVGRLVAPAMLVCLLAVIGAFAYFKLKPTPAVPPPQAEAVPVEVKPTLGLVVERRGNSLMVTWDGSADVISRANFGMLLIRGDSASRDIPLTADELRGGSLVYAALADRVRFQLNVVAGEQVVRESLTVVLPQSPGGVTKVLSTSAVRAPVADSSAATAHTSRPEEQPAPVRALREFRPVKRDVPAVASQGIAEPPPVTGPARPNIATLPLPVPPPISGPANFSADRTAPVPERKPEENGAGLAAEAYPPIAMRQVVPRVPAHLKGVMWSRSVVEVIVSVDAAGNVVKAEAVPKPGTNSLLRDAAVEAAGQWKFRPAQFNGHSVPANITVQFNFPASR